MNMQAINAMPPLPLCFAGSWQCISWHLTWASTPNPCKWSAQKSAPTFIYVSLFLSLHGHLLFPSWWKLYTVYCFAWPITCLSLSQWWNHGLLDKWKQWARTNISGYLVNCSTHRHPNNWIRCELVGPKGFSDRVASERAWQLNFGEPHGEPYYGKPYYGEPYGEPWSDYGWPVAPPGHRATSNQTQASSPCWCMSSKVTRFPC